MRGPEDPSPSLSALSSQRWGEGDKAPQAGEDVQGERLRVKSLEQGACASAVAGRMAVPRGQEPTCPSRQHCHIVTGASPAAGAVWPHSGCQRRQPAPNPGQRPGQAQPAHGLPPGLEAWPCLLHFCWLRGGPEAPSMAGPSLRRGGAGVGGVLVTEQRCEARHPWAQSV